LHFLRIWNSYSFSTILFFIFIVFSSVFFSEFNRMDVILQLILYL
jgi:hypothetical protein